LEVVLSLAPRTKVPPGAAHRIAAVPEPLSWTRTIPDDAAITGAEAEPELGTNRGVSAEPPLMLDEKDILYNIQRFNRMLTHRQRVLKRFGLTDSDHPSIVELSRMSGYPVATLQQVYNRGIGAWKTNPESVRVKGTFIKNPSLKEYPRKMRLGKEQWAMARIYSFLDKGRTYYTADSDLA
jgi:hypothetical protein